MVESAPNFGEPPLQPACEPSADGVGAASRPWQSRLRLMSRRWMRPIPERVFVDLVRVGEVVILAASSYAIYAAYVIWLMGTTASDYIAATAVGLLVWLVLSGCTLRWSVAELRDMAALRGVATCWSSTIAVLCVLAFLQHSTGAYSRGWLIAWFFIGLAALTAYRATIAAVLHATGNGPLKRGIVILGAGHLGLRLAEHIKVNAALGITTAAIFDDRQSRLAGAGSALRRGAFAAALDFIRDNEIDCVIIALPLAAEARIMQLISELRQLPVDVGVVSDTVGFRMLSHGVPNIAGIPILVAAERPMKEWRGVLKAIEDKVVAMVALVLLLPLLLVIAAAIKLTSRGPVLFRQPRRGFNQKIFHVYKFRTMYVEATDRLGDQLTTRGDRRVTGVGALLRKTSLDELPQLVNVLRGDMSIVGPRPHPLNAKAANRRYDDVVQSYAARHRVKPGITGWAQVNGWRGQTDTVEQIERRVEHDLRYIENWSLGFDMWIIMLSAWRGFYHKNAF